MRRDFEMTKLLLDFGADPDAGIFEIQADMLGLAYLINARHDSQSLVTVFERWKGKFVCHKLPICLVSDTP
jgi:hypothetical protein